MAGKDGQCWRPLPPLPPLPPPPRTRPALRPPRMPPPPGAHGKPSGSAVHREPLPRQSALTGKGERAHSASTQATSNSDKPQAPVPEALRECGRRAVLTGAPGGSLRPWGGGTCPA